jgi:hypothetical protein
MSSIEFHFQPIRLASPDKMMRIVTKYRRFTETRAIKKLIKPHVTNIQSCEYDENDTISCVSLDVKVQMVAMNFHRQIKENIKDGVDPYHTFDKNWYRNCKKKEPSFDKIMNQAFQEYLNDYGWSIDDYKRAIEK